MRPRISDKTEERLRSYMEEHPEKALSNVGEAIDHLIPKALKYDDEEQIRKLIDERLEEKLDERP